MIGVAEIPTDSIADHIATERLRTLADYLPPARTLVPAGLRSGEAPATGQHGLWEVLAACTLRLLGSGHNDFETRPVAGVRVRPAVPATNLTLPGFEVIHFVGHGGPTGVQWREQLTSAPVFMGVTFTSVAFAQYDALGVEPVAESLAERSARGDIAGALDEAFEFFETEMLNHRRHRCESLLERLNADVLPAEVCVGLLTATRPWRGQLRNRGALFAQTKARLLEQYEGPRVARILGGLE
jgi:hypothetical protein